MYEDKFDLEYYNNFIKIMNKKIENGQKSEKAKIINLILRRNEYNG